MQTFPIAAAATKAFWILPLAFIPIAIAIGLILITTIGGRTARFEVSPEGLRLRGDLYGRLIPSGELRGGEARRVDFATSPELLPKRRTFGTGLPGYQAGWFRLESGEKALLYLTDRSRAVYIPTTAGYSVLLSPENPDGLLAAIASIGRQ
jgi:hypothetical protein